MRCLEWIKRDNAPVVPEVIDMRSPDCVGKEIVRGFVIQDCQYYPETGRVRMIVEPMSAPRSCGIIKFHRED